MARREQNLPCLSSRGVTHHGFHGFAPHARALTATAGRLHLLSVQAAIFVDVAVIEQALVLWAFHGHDEGSLQVAFAPAQRFGMQLVDVDAFVFEHTAPHFVVGHGAQC
mgnify:CR=1 FL=1